MTVALACLVILTLHSIGTGKSAYFIRKNLLGFEQDVLT